MFYVKMMTKQILTIFGRVKIAEIGFHIEVAYCVSDYQLWTAAVTEECHRWIFDSQNVNGQNLFVRYLQHVSCMSHNTVEDYLCVHYLCQLGTHEES